MTEHEQKITQFTAAEAFELVQKGIWTFGEFDLWLFYIEEKALNKGVEFADSRPSPL